MNLSSFYSRIQKNNGNNIFCREEANYVSIKLTQRIKTIFIP